MVSSMAEQRRSLCNAILEYYKSACDRLPTSLIPRVHEAGFGFGFLDPVSNIIANTVLHKASPDAMVEANQEEQGRRREIKRKRSQPGTCSTGSSSSSKAVCISDFSSIAARSLQGLVTFLTSYFRYLRTREALYYLTVSNADLLVAVHLIETDRCAGCAFTANHRTSKIALSCAALSAKHPQPGEFVSTSLVLASRLKEVHGLLQTHDTMNLSKISAEGEHFGADPHEPMRDAVKRFQRSGVRMPFPDEISHELGIDHELSMKRLLLDRIHGFDLEAISRLPTTLLRSRLHRPLLKAGHCYGPFDAVSNILLNTIWYDTMFPTQHEFKVDVVLMENLALVESRSLNGLVASVVSTFPTLIMRGILWYLLKFGSLDGMIKNVGETFPAPILVSPSAYLAAATGACHPHPDALVSFVAELPQEVEVIVMPLLKAKNTLSVDDVEAISKSVSGNHPRIGSVSELEWSKLDSKSISDSCKKFKAHQRYICRRVEAALQEHARRQGDDYELHSICGVNGKIPQDGKYGYFLNRNGYPYSHINAWVTRRDSHRTDAVPILLFIECSNNKDMKGAPFLCCVVSESSEDAGRCFHCERAGTKIVHPSLRSYHGQEKDFEDMACGKHSLTNEELIGFGESRTVFADVVETEPLMYLDIAELRHLADVS